MGRSFEWLQLKKITTSLRAWLRPWRVALFLVVSFAAFSQYLRRMESQVHDVGVVYNRAVHPNLPVFSHKVEVGTQDLPELRSLYIVDPGIEQRFSSPLISSLDSILQSDVAQKLQPFQIKSQVISLAQRPPDLNVSDPMRMNEFIRTMREPASLSASEVQKMREPTELGKAFGDSIGYSVKKGPQRYEFKLSPVVGLSGEQVSSEIRKGVFDSHELFFQDLQKRVSIVQTPQLANYSFNRDLLEARSGMCALARTLKEPSLFTGSEIPSIYLFSDVDDFDPSGQYCLSGYRQSNGDETLVSGSCETRNTIFELEREENRGHQCIYQYSDDYKYKVIRETPRWSSAASYYQISHFKCDETELKFLEVTEWKRRMTQVSVVFEVPLGENQWTSSHKKVWLDGALNPSECDKKIQELAGPSGRVIKKSCEWKDYPVPSKEPEISSCSYRDIHCQVAKTESRVFEFPGDYQSQCAVQAMARSGSVVPGTSECRMTGQIRTSVTPLPMCRPVIATSKDHKKDINEDLRTTEACQEKAISLGGYVDEKYPALCQSMLGVARARIEGAIQIKSFRISPYDVFRNNETDCPFEVKTEIARQNGFLVDEIVSCKLSPGEQKLAQEKLVDDSCHRQSYRYCRARPELLNCGLKSEIYAGLGRRKLALRADEDLSCKSLCRDSKTNFCGDTQGQSLTVEDFFKEKYGMISRCKSETRSDQVLSSFFARDPNEVQNICGERHQGSPIYSKVESEFKFDGYIPEFVTGNKVQDGRLVPKMSLIEFIQTRIQEIYGSQNLDIHFFIHRMGDPLYSSGRFGKLYQELALKIGAQVHSLNSLTFQQVFKESLEFNLQKVSRRFLVNGIKASQSIVHVKLYKKSGEQVLDLNDSDWWQSGGSVQINPRVHLEVGDQLEVLYQ
jgi:hypothetical protein